MAKANQTNLELGKDALSRGEMVKLNSEMVEAVVLAVSPKVLMNHTVLPHFLPKSLFVPPTNEFEQHADHNVLRFHSGNQSQLGYDKAAFDNRKYRKVVRNKPRKAVYTAAKRVNTNNINALVELFVQNCSVKDAL